MNTACKNCEKSAGFMAYSKKIPLKTKK